MFKSPDQTIERTVMVSWLFENVVFRYSQYYNLLGRCSLTEK